MVIAAERFLQPQGALRHKRLESPLLLYVLFFCQGKQTTGLHTNIIPLKWGRKYFVTQHISLENDAMETQWVPSWTKQM